MKFKKSILLSTLILSACNTTSDKKVSNPNRDSVEWQQYDGKHFTLQYASDSHIETVSVDESSNSEWINVTYPLYDLKVYCTYLDIDKETLYGALEDTYKLLASHQLVASGMYEEHLTMVNANEEAILFHLKGPVATPIQFFVTDGENHFFRGSLYYNRQVDTDSVAPITQFIKEDIVHLMKTIQWNDKAKPECCKQVRQE